MPKDLNVNAELVNASGVIDDSNPMPMSDADLGDVDDAAVVDPAEDATAIALLKGLLTGINTLNTNITTLNTALGAIDDAAVTNPASDATVIAALKGIVTNTTPT